MEPASFVSPPAKRPLDPSSDAHRVDYNGSASSAKRRHHSSIRHPPPPLKLSPGETLFRVLCPADKTGAVIGKGGSIIRQFRQSTGAKIRIEDAVSSCDERVILIVAPNVVDPAKRPRDLDTEANTVSNSEKKAENPKEEETENYAEGDLVSASPAQQALVKVFERMVRVDEERLMGGVGEGDEGEQRVGSATSDISALQGLVVCRLLAPSNQVGCVLGKGGKIVEKIRQESGAQIRVLSKEQLPACSAAGDELIQITGNVASVRKALLSVSSCLQDNPRSDVTNFFSTKPSGPVLRGLGPPGQLEPFPQRSFGPPLPASDYFPRESLASGHRNLEEEVVFRLLCSSDKVGSLIGKGGGIVRTLQVETGALIKVLESMPDSDEQVVFISAVENMELKHSPAQEAVMRVQSRLAELVSDSALVSVRLLVPAQQIGCLLGKGGNIIAEMRRATGASIRIFVNEHVPKCAAPNDEVVQVNGTMQSVQDALFHITSRLRESIFPIRPNGGGGQNLSMGPETPPFMFRSRHEPTSPRHLPPSIAHPHGPRLMDRQLSLSRGMDHVGFATADRGPHSFSSERPGSGPTYDQSTSPRSWAPPAVTSGNVRGGITDARSAFTPRNGSIGSASKVAVVTSTSVEVMVPQQFLGFIYGENGGNLNQIRQISGAKVIIHDPSPGATEGIVIITGTPDQTQAAQSLLHAFILCGQSSSSS